MKQRKNCKRLLAGVLMLAALVSALSGCGKPKRTAKEVEGTTLGIDVARFQGIIDWKEVAGSHIDFAMIRLGYRANDDGGIKLDSTARYNLQEANKYGIPIGAYFFSTATSVEEAEEEARWAAEIMAKYSITYPVVYDCEGYQEPDSRMRDLSRKQRTDHALAFLKTIEKLGYEGMFYASKNEMEGGRHWDISRIEKRYKVWVAQYPEVPYPDTPQSSYSGPHHMWQYSTEGDIPGISQNVDLNVAYFGYEGIEPPKDPTPPEEVSPDVEALMVFEEVNEEVTAKDEVNLRSVPSQGADSRVLDTLKNGQIATRIAISSSGWSKLVVDGTVCYAVSSYLTTDMNYSGAEQGKDDDGIQTVFTEVSYKLTAKDVVNLRSIPSVTSEESKVVRQLKNGEYVDCIGISDNGWAKLSVNGEILYAVSSYLTKLGAVETPHDAGEINAMFTSVQEKVTPRDKVNLRNIPSTTREDAKVVLQLKNGDVVTRTGINKELGWSRIEFEGQTLYCVSSYLEKVEQ